MESKEQKTQKNRLLRTLIWFLLVVVAANVWMTVFFAKRWNNISGTHSEEIDPATYEYHFAMITTDDNEEFWNSVYEGAQAAGNPMNAWVERMGADLNEHYSLNELMQIAIAAHVDGILLEYNEDEGMSDLIQEATEQGIPVVTLIRDDTSGSRISHVGISYYNLGQQYAEQILSILAEREEETRVTLLMNSDFTDSSRTILYSTIQETLTSDPESAGMIHVEPVMVNETNSFEVEESIRDIFMDAENLPDILVCLDEITSACVYQALIDYNEVGQVEEIAYYGSASILEGIRKGIIYSTTSVDTNSIGRNGVNALLEYVETGYVSDYYSVDTFTIDRSNIAVYLGGDADEE